MVCFLDIKSTPSDAKVYIDGNYVGNTPIEDRRMDPGFYNIRIEKTGYTSYQHLNY